MLLSHLENSDSECRGKAGTGQEWRTRRNVVVVVRYGIVLCPEYVLDIELSDKARPDGPVGRRVEPRKGRNSYGIVCRSEIRRLIHNSQADSKVIKHRWPLVLTRYKEP